MKTFHIRIELVPYVLGTIREGSDTVREYRKVARQRWLYSVATPQGAVHYGRALTLAGAHRAARKMADSLADAPPFVYRYVPGVGPVDEDPDLIGREHVPDPASHGAVGEGHLLPWYRFDRRWGR